jgi:DNA-directed RNA polymerase subunit RPC12/RpoP
MNAAWIPLECTACDETWEATPESLPEPDTEFECPYCSDRSPVKSFVKTREGLQILEEFQG